MDNWYAEEYYMRQRQEELLHEAELITMARLAAAGREPGRPIYLAVTQAVEWIQCQTGTLLWRLERWIRAARPSSAVLVAVPARQSEPCQRAAHE
jgi:hypothetical protein